MQKPRYLAFDALKIVLAILVINVHYEAIIINKTFTPLFYLGWYAVPLFILMSFYFNSKYLNSPNVSVNILKEKIKRLLAPLIFWSVIAFLIYPGYISPTHLLRQMVFGTVVDVPLYYLNVLIALTVSWFIFSKILKQRFILFLTLALIVVLGIETSGLNISLIKALPNPLEYFFTRYLEFFKYAVIGTLLSLFLPFFKRLPKIKPLAFAVFVFSASIDTVFLWQKQTDLVIYSGLLQVLSVSSLILFLSLTQELVFPSIVAKTIQTLSRYVLGVYCIHFFFIENLRKILQDHQTNYQEAQFPIVILIFSLCYIISFLIDKTSRGYLKNTIS